MTPSIRSLQQVKPFLWRYRLEIVFGGIYFLISLFALLHFLHISLLGDRYERATFDFMYAGTAWKPFVYRVLIPKLAQSIVAITPQALRDAIVALMQAWLQEDGIVKNALPWVSHSLPNSHLYARLVTVALIYASLCGYGIVIYKLAGRLFPENEAIRLFAPVFAMGSISMFSGYGTQYIYDIPVLFLSASCYYFLLMRRFRPYIGLFFLACLNRETAIFIWLFFAFWFYRRLDRKTYLSLHALQCLIYAGVKIALTLAYLSNPGPFLEYNMPHVLVFIFSRMGYETLVDMAVLFFLLTYRWQEKPAFLKAGFCVFPFMYAAYIVFGMPAEYRIFFDILPLFILLGTHTLMETSGLANFRFFATVSSKDNHDALA